MSGPNDPFATIDPFGLGEEAQPEYEWPPSAWGGEIAAGSGDPGTQRFQEEPEWMQPSAEEQALAESSEGTENDLMPWQGDAGAAAEILDPWQEDAAAADAAAVPAPDPADEQWSDPAPWQGGVLPEEAPSLIDDLEAPQARAPAPYEADDTLEISQDPYSTEGRLTTLESMDPLQRASLLAKEDEERRQVEAQLRQQEIDDDNDRQLDNQWRLEKAGLDAKERTDEIMREAKELAQTPIDDARWFSQGPGGGGLRTAFALLGAAFGGVGAARTGKNQAVEQILGMVDRDIKMQQDSIKGQIQGLMTAKGAVADEYARHGDLYRASETVRLGYLKGLDDRIAAEMVQYDPEGSTARRQLAMRQEVQARIEKTGAEVAAQQRADALARVKEERNQEKHRVDLAKTNEETYKAKANTRKLNAEAAKLERPGGSGKPKGPSHATMLSALKSGFRWDGTKWVKDIASAGAEAQRLRDLTPETARTTEDWEHVKIKGEARMRYADARDKENKTSTGPGGNPYAHANPDGSGVIKNRDRSDFTSSGEARSRVNSLLPAATLIRRGADLAKIIRDKYGGASEILGSKEYQELKSLDMQTAFETYKAFGLGAPSAGDQMLEGGSKGGKDITSFIYDAATGWDFYADGVEAKLNSEMINAGYEGDYFTVPRRYAAVSIDRTPEQLKSSLSEELPKAFADNPVERAKYFDQKAADAERLVKHHKPSRMELETYGRVMRTQIDRGTRTRAEAEQVAIPLAKRLAELESKEQKTLIQSLGDAALDEKTNDPDYMRRLSKLKAAEGGDPSAAFDLVVGKSDPRARERAEYVDRLTSPFTSPDESHGPPMQRPLTSEEEGTARYSYERPQE